MENERSNSTILRLIGGENLDIIIDLVIDLGKCLNSFIFIKDQQRQ